MCVFSAAHIGLFCCVLRMNVYMFLLIAELHRYRGALGDAETKDTNATLPDSKQGGGMPSRTPSDPAAASVPQIPVSDIYHSQRTSSIVLQSPGQRTLQKWKGPDKISLIYGDWIDDIQ